MLKSSMYYKRCDDIIFNETESSKRACSDLVIYFMISSIFQMDMVMIIVVKLNYHTENTK